MHAKPDLRVPIEDKITRSGSVITAVMSLLNPMNKPNVAILFTGPKQGSRHKLDGLPFDDEFGLGSYGREFSGNALVVSVDTRQVRELPVSVGHSFSKGHFYFLPDPPSVFPCLVTDELDFHLVYVGDVTVQIAHGSELDDNWIAICSDDWIGPFDRANPIFN